MVQVCSAPHRLCLNAWFSADGTVLEGEGPARGGELLGLGVDFFKAYCQAQL